MDGQLLGSWRDIFARGRLWAAAGAVALAPFVAHAESPLDSTPDSSWPWWAYTPNLPSERIASFYLGAALASMTAVLVGLLVQSRRQARQIEKLRRPLEELRQAEEKQHFLLRRLRTHIENTLLVVIELDAGRHFRQWTGRAEALFGWREMEVTGQPMDALPWVEADGLPALREAFAGPDNAAVTGRVVTVPHRTRDGQRRLIEWHVTALAGATPQDESVMALGLDVTEREEALATLRREREQYAQAVKASSAGFWSLDPEKGGLTWDAHLADLLGYPPADFPTRLNQWYDLVHPDDLEGLKVAVTTAAAEGAGKQAIEARLRHRDGTYRWFQLVLGREAAPGQPARVTGTATDRTRLRLAEEKFRGLVEHSLAGIFILQANRVAFANPKFWVITRGGAGRPPVRPEFLELVQPDDRAMVAARLRPLYAGEAQEVPLLFRVAGPQGRAIAVQGHAIASEHEGEPAILGLVMDVSHRFAQEQASRRLSQVVEQNPVGILITDPQGVIEYVNPKLCELSGYAPEELLGQSARVLLAPAMPEEFYVELGARLHQGKKWEGEFVNHAKDGHTFTTRAHLFPIFDEGGAITHHVQIIEDITSQRSLEERLARAQRLESIGNLAGGIAHDLNNILAPVRLGAEFLKTLPFQGQEREIIEVMEMSIHRASELVQQVLAFSRGRRGKREVVQPAKIITEIERFVRESFPKDVPLETTVAANLWSVNADPTQLLQVLMNLVVNSRDAMPGGGIIALVADNIALTTTQTGAFPGARPGPHVRVRVSDTGSGITPEVRQKIFEPFFTTKDIGKGTGLGLSTALGIVQEHGGILELESTGPEGTTFVLYLPALPSDAADQPLFAPGSARNLADSAAAAARSAIKSTPSPGAKTVLVVDDEAALRQTVAFVLEQRGYHVLEAADGFQAIEMVRAHGGDVAAVVLDVMMPRLDGVATLKALRELRPNLHVVATSGVNNDTRIESLRQLGVRQFLLKPYRNQELLEALQAGLDSAAAAAGSGA